MRDLRGKRVLVTGAAQGIGLAIARGFADAGAEVVLTDVRDDALDRAVSSIETVGGQVRGYVLDVTDASAIAAFRERLHAESGPVDVLVNNAGVVFGGPFLEVPLERHMATLRVNIEGVVAVTQAFLADLIARPEGHLVNIASASGFIGLPYGSTYACSKWAVIGFAESIRLELELQGHRHVRVTTVCPSYVDTGLFDGARPPLTTRMLTPERLAAQVLRAVRRNRLFVLTPWLVKVTPPLRALLPTRLFDRMARTLGATTSMLDWHGHRSE